MNNARWSYGAVVAASLLLGCNERVLAPNQTSEISTSSGGTSPTVVIVNPYLRGEGPPPVREPGVDMVSTIQAGVDAVVPGGKVLLLAGTYSERVRISKGITLQPFSAPDIPVVIEQSLPSSSPATQGVILIETTEPVVIQDLTVRQDNIRGINALFRGVDLTLERVSFEGVSDVAPIVGNGVTVTNKDANGSGRARLRVVDSRFAVGGIGISLGGDVDAVIEGNDFDHAKSRSVCIIASPTGQGTGATVPAGAQINIEIRNNTLANCGTDANRFPGRGFNAIAIQGAPAAATTGTVNIVGNIFRTRPTLPGAPEACPAGAILYEAYSGVIERNTIVDVIKSCTPEPVGPRNQAAAIYIGSRIAGIRAAAVSVRFNDLRGNAYAGLRIGSNQPESIDATCNWWGHPGGPAGAGSGSGDAIVVEADGVAPDGVAPRFAPFATAPIAETSATNCSGSS